MSATCATSATRARFVAEREGWLRHDDAHRHLGIGSSTLKRWRAEGRVRFRQPGGPRTTVFYERDDLDAAVKGDALADELAARRPRGTRGS